MKSRYKILIGIIVAISITLISLEYNQETKSVMGIITSNEKPEPVHIPDPICFVIDRATGGSGGAVSMDRCFPLSEFENMGCTRPMLEHLYKYSNILDEEFDGLFYIEWVSLPDEVSEEQFEECVDIIHEKRLSADLSSLTYKDFGISSSEPVYPIEVSTDEQLQRVLDKCEYKRKKVSGEIPSFTSDGTPILSTLSLLSWNNSTHYNDNNICYFQPLKEHLEYDLLGGVLEYCNSSKGAGWNNPFEVWFANETHYIDSDICLWQKLDDSIVLVLPTNWQNVYEDDFEKTATGSYELENPLCIGGRGFIENEDCERIGKYDVSTGLPIVENKEQCDMLDGDWNEQQNSCDSKYGMMKENEK